MSASTMQEGKSEPTKVCSLLPVLFSAPCSKIGPQQRTLALLWLDIRKREPIHVPIRGININYHFRAEEVQGLVKYIYTGQLAAPAAKEPVWQKIFVEFQIGMLPEEEENMEESQVLDALPLVRSSFSV